MNKNVKQTNVFIDTIQIETHTIFFENGSIYTSPCAFEENPHLVLHGDRASQKGRMVTEDDGTSHFHPYATDSGSRYNTLLRTAHGTVKETQEQVIFQLRFPKRLSKAIIEHLFRKETSEQAAFVRSRHNETQWAS